MVLSMVAVDINFNNTSILVTDASANNSDELVLEMLIGGTVIGREFNGFPGGTATPGNPTFTPGSTSVTLRAGHYNAAGTFVPYSDAQIFFTTSDTTNHGTHPLDGASFNIQACGGSGVSPHATSGCAIPSNSGRGAAALTAACVPMGPTTQNVIPLGVHPYIVNRVARRHAGGVSPNNAGGGQPYSSPIAIPARATAAATMANHPAPAHNPPIDLEGNRDVFVISAVAYRGADVARLTRSFILVPPPCATVQGCPVRRGTAPWPTEAERLSHRSCAWAKAHGELMVFSLYSDSHLLFDHDTGLLFPGHWREEWIRDYIRLNPTNNTGNRPYDDGIRTRPDFVDFDLLEAYGPTLPANFNKRGRGIAVEDGGVRPNDRAWGGAEVPGFVEMFDHNGMRHIAQGAGFRVKGGWSRGTDLYEQRTFEFYARNSYNDFYGGGRKSSFEFPLFEQQNVIDQRTRSQGNILQEYRRFRVRNWGSDRLRAGVRDELGATLSTQAGIPTPPQNYRPAVVFLNGAFYGAVFMKSPRTENHWEEMYGGNENRFHQIGSNEMGSDTCFSRSCGRIIPGSAGSPDSPGITASDVVVPGQPAGSYTGQYPNTCTGGSSTTRCTGTREAVCRQYHSSPDRMCEAYGTTSSGPNACQHGKALSTSSTSGRCTGCRASCDWATVVDLVLGGPVPGRPDLGSPNPAPNTNRTQQRLNTNGLTTPARWAAFKEKVDVDAFMQYYAVNTFGANIDWPGNNIEWWRYYPTEAELERIEAGEMHPHLDGRWRPISQDLEMGMGIWNTGGANLNRATAPDYNTINALMNRNGIRGGDNHWQANANTFMMRAMLGGVGSNQTGDVAVPANAPQLEARAIFANAMSDLVDGAFSTTNSRAVVDRLLWLIENEHHNGVLRPPGPEGMNAPLPGYRRIAELPRGIIQFGPRIPGAEADWSWWYAWPRWSGGEDPTAAITGETAGEHFSIRNFLANRPAGIQAAVGASATSTTAQGLGLAWTARNVQVTVSVPAANGAEASQGYAIMNTRPLGMLGLPHSGGNVQDPRSAGRGSGITGRYFPGTPIPITAVPVRGYEAVWPTSVSGGTLAPDPLQPWNNNRRLFTPTGSSATATIALTFRRCPDFIADNSNLDIRNIRARSFDSNANDWITIYNPTNHHVSTRGMYLTDNTGSSFGGNSGGNMDKWQMPSFVVPAGGSIRIRTSGNTQNNAFLKRAQTNFNLGFNERLRITKTDGETVTEILRVYVGIMGDNQIQERNWLDGLYRIYPINTSTNMAQETGHVNPGIGLGFGAADANSHMVRPPTVPECPHGTSPPSACIICNPPGTATLYNMGTDANMTGASAPGTGSSNWNRHPFFYVSGGERTLSNASMSFTGLTGTSQGVRIHGLHAGMAKPNHIYRIEVTAQIRSGGSPVAGNLQFRIANPPADNINILRPIAAGGSTVTVDLTFAQIQAIAAGSANNYISIGVAEATSAANARDLNITMFRVIEMPA
jgi:hypothetical protein